MDYSKYFFRNLQALSLLYRGKTPLRARSCAAAVRSACRSMRLRVSDTPVLPRQAVNNQFHPHMGSVGNPARRGGPCSAPDRPEHR